MRLRGLARHPLFLPAALFVAALSLHFFAASPLRVERWYSTGIYPPIATLLRTITGWVPFSIGDIIYMFLVLYVTWKITAFFRAKRKGKGVSPKRTLLQTITIILIIYLVFNILWGINYNRAGISHQMGLQQGNYTREELLTVNRLLLQQVNEYRESLTANNYPIPGKKELLAAATRVYARAGETYPFLAYKPISLKPSMLNWLGNYWGFSGYYNPFTGEAQANMDVPAFSQPFMMLHEIAHQLGYARENEANFVGYIAATASADTLFMYSACFDVFLYANRSLRRVDSTAAADISSGLHPAAKADLEELKKYYRKYENPMEPVIRWVYGKYLQVNAQPMGMMSYNEVVADLIAYYKKYGTISARPGVRP